MPEPKTTEEHHFAYDSKKVRMTGGNRRSYEKQILALQEEVARLHDHSKRCLRSESEAMDEAAVLRADVKGLELRVDAQARVIRELEGDVYAVKGKLTWRDVALHLWKRLKGDVGLAALLSEVEEECGKK